MTESPAHRSISFASLVAACALASCASPQAGSVGGPEPRGLAKLFLQKEKPGSLEDASASLQKIADSDYAQLPAAYRAVPIDPLEADDFGNGGDPGTRDEWNREGLHPDEVNPGDIFVERDGVRLRKIFSLLDGLDEDDRASELGRFASTATERMPVTLSRAEIAGVAAKLEDDVTLPTRSVALDVRSSTHTLDPARFQEALAGIEKGGKGDPRRQRLRTQLRDVKSRLARGEELHLVTAVTESAAIEATYPGAPVGKRDAEAVRNAILCSFPHLGDIGAEKVDSKILVTGQPRLIWEFDSRALHMEKDRLAFAANGTRTN